MDLNIMDFPPFDYLLRALNVLEEQLSCADTYGIL